MQHVVSFSGGVGSWMAAKRVAERHGTGNLTLLFADTLIEDEDLYRFIDEAARDVGGRFVRIAEGRTPWQVFRDVRFIGNNRVDPCSKILKRDLLDRYISEHFDPNDTTIYVGIDWSEEHRFTRLKPRKAAAGWRYEAPLCEAPYLTKKQMFEALRQAGIKPPRLYEMGFPHNNCGGFCVKAGQGAFALLLEHMPQRYAEHEAEERALRQVLGGKVSILRDRRGGTTKPMTLADFRRRLESGEKADKFDLGGCGCAIDDGADDKTLADLLQDATASRLEVTRTLSR